MIKASEIMLPIFVENKTGKVVAVYGYLGAKAFVSEDGLSYEFVQDLHPIPLTPEWLERFGAVVHHKHDWVYVINDIEITTASNGETFQVHLRLFNRVFTLHYVHQFQNAFALTGQELELKEAAQKEKP